MDPDRWQQVDSLLQLVLERPPGERQEYLRQTCNGDEALEREVRPLLSSHQQAESFLESPAMDMAARSISGPQNKHASENLGPLELDRKKSERSCYAKLSRDHGSG